MTKGRHMNTPNRSGTWGRSGRRPAWVLLACFVLAGCEELLGGGDAGPDSGSVGRDAGSSGPGCGLASEPEPNDDRSQAAALPGGGATGCVATAADVDFYEVAAPNDPAGGYFQASVTDVGAGKVEVKVFSATDNAQIDRVFTSDAGASQFFFWAAAPGQRYRLAVVGLQPFNAGFRYTLRAGYSRINDPFEPNDTRDTAKPITLGAANAAFMFAGHRSGAVESGAFRDWYSVILGAGMVNVRVDDVPTNVRVEAFLYDADGSMVDAARMANDTFGGSINVTTAVLKPGPHRLELGTFPPAPETSGKGNVLPDNYTRAYKVTVTQR